MATDLQASHAMFWRRGGGSVFASSCIWFCMEGVGRPGMAVEDKEEYRWVGCAVTAIIICFTRGSES